MLRTWIFPFAPAWVAGGVAFAIADVDSSVFAFAIFAIAGVLVAWRR